MKFAASRIAITGSSGNFADSLAVFAAPLTHWTKVLFAVVGTGSKITFDYVTRRFNVWAG
jgi:hypothetical protein